MQLDPSRALPAGLSERELEVLLALAHGGSNREIADGPRDLRQDRRPPRPERLREGRRAQPCGRDAVGLRARSRPPGARHHRRRGLQFRNDCRDIADEHRAGPSARFGGDVHARGCLPLRTAPPRGRGRAVRRLHLQLPCLPATHRERLRDAGRLQGGSGAGQRPVQRLLPHLGRGGQEGARLPLLPRLRLAGLLHGADGAGPDRRLGRRVRRPVVPAADGVGLRLAPASVGAAARVDLALRARAVGPGAAGLRRRAGTRRRRRWGSS